MTHTSHYDATWCNGLYPSLPLLLIPLTPPLCGRCDDLRCCGSTNGMAAAWQRPPMTERFCCIDNQHSNSNFTYKAASLAQYQIKHSFPFWNFPLILLLAHTAHFGKIRYVSLTLVLLFITCQWYFPSEKILLQLFFSSGQINYILVSILNDIIILLTLISILK